MKLSLTALFASFFTIITPTIPMILLAMLIVSLKSLFAVWRTIKLKGWCGLSYKRSLNGFGIMIIYGMAIIVVFCIEKYIAGDIISQFIAVELFMTKLVAFAVVVTEIRSIDTMYKQVKGKSFLKGLRNIIMKLKNEKDKFEL